MNKNHIIIENFICVHYRNSVIYADKCEIFTECCIILYKNNEIITTINDTEIIVQKVGNMHYYIHGKDITMYLILQKRDISINLSKIKVDDIVYPNNDTIFNKEYSTSWLMILILLTKKMDENTLKEKTIEEMGYIVEEIIFENAKEQSIIKIRKGDTVKYIFRKDISSFEDVVDSYKILNKEKDSN